VLTHDTHDTYVCQYTTFRAKNIPRTYRCILKFYFVCKKIGPDTMNHNTLYEKRILNGSADQVMPVTTYKCTPKSPWMVTVHTRPELEASNWILTSRCLELIYISIHTIFTNSSPFRVFPAAAVAVSLLGENRSLNLLLIICLFQSIFLSEELVAFICRKRLSASSRLWSE
jgi:hypothetical protein